MALNEIISSFVGENTGEQLLIALGIFAGLFLVFKLTDMFVLAILKKASEKTKNTWDDVIIDFLKNIKWPFYAFISLYVASLTLSTPLLIRNVLKILLVIFIFFYAAKGASGIINHYVGKEVAKIEKNEIKRSTSMVKILGVIGKLIVWILALLMALSNFGVEITPLIAGLGIGGIAIALALQTVLSDLFSAFAIYLDKPFQEGDFIIIGNDMGVVRHIGIKTTRIESLQGQELVVSNSELTSTRINNYKRMAKRRIQFSFGIEYNTPTKKMKKIPGMVKKIIDGAEGCDYDRAHFKSFGDFSLNYEVVYYVATGDYNKYMDVQQEINLKIKEAFEKERIEFAFPTQTLYLKK